MRNSMPLRWIEEAEQSHFLTTVCFTQPAARPRRSRATLTDRLGRACNQLAELLLPALPPLQAQPIPVRHTGRRIINTDYGCR